MLYTCVFKIALVQVPLLRAIYPFYFVKIFSRVDSGGASKGSGPLPPYSQ